MAPDASPDTDSTTDLTVRKGRWLAQRKTCITATDVAKILGVSKFGGPIDVFLEKTGQGQEIDQNAGPLKWGRRAEPMILAAYHEDVAPLVIEPPFTLRHFEAEPLIAATLDARRVLSTAGAAGFVAQHDGRPVDAKNIRFETPEWGEHGTDHMPLYYATQLAVQMLVTGAQYADLAVLFSGNEDRVYTLERDDAMLQAIVARCTAFWKEHVETGRPPAPDGSASFAAYLKRTFAQHSDVMLQATQEQHERAVLLNVARETLEAAERSKTALENAFKEEIGTANAKGIDGPRGCWKVSWGLTKDSTGVDWEAIAKDLALEHAQLSGRAATQMIDQMAKDPKYTRVTKKGSRRFLFQYNNA